MASILHAAGDVVDSVGHQIHTTTKRVGKEVETSTHRILPPSRREQILENFRHYARHNPKAAAFLATQGAFTGLPLTLFLAFATATLLVSLSTCLFLGLLAALAFSFFVLGFALLFVVPTVFIASCSATFIFMWGLVGYVILRRLNEGEAPAKPGTRVGDTLQALTGGRSAHYFDGQAYSQSAGASSKGRQVGAHVDRAEGGEGRVGAAGHTHHRVSARHGDGGFVNGTNGAADWAVGVITEPVESKVGTADEVTQAVILDEGDANTGSRISAFGGPTGEPGRTYRDPQLVHCFHTPTKDVHS